MSNILEIGKIVRPHGIKGAVKIISYLEDADLSEFKQILIGKNLEKANITKISMLNNDAYLVYIDIIPNIEIAEQYRNQYVYIDRSQYKDFKDKIYLSDLIGAPVLDENHKKLGELVDFDDYGASAILQIKAGAVSYSLPFVEDIVTYDDKLNAFVTTKQKFEDLRV